MAASIFQLVGEIVVNAESAHKQIEGTAKKAEGLSKNFSKVGAVALKVGKATVAGAAAIAAGVGTLLKASISSYAEYEQLVGGVETLFKDSSGKVMQYANNAYKTAGLSANEYMETVTSFSASLISSMKGDTEAAAEVANMALTDMSDNANKMGTSMSSIQNAYQGFAKGNMTMLDNLKIGYGGTQSEMKRLLKDAQKISGQKYNIKNFDDIIEAIHVIQTEMGITGTTAKEASETISGSFSALGSAWENLLTGMSTDGANVDALMKNVFLAAENVAVNIGKLLPVFAKNLGAMIGSLGQYAGTKIKSVWTNTVYPKIQNALKVNFGIEMPDWDTFKTNVSTWWTNAKTQIDNICYWTLKHLGITEWTEEDTVAIRAWWDNVYEKIVSICKWMLKPEFPDSETVIADLTAWWEETKKGLKLTFGITPQVEGYHADVQNTVDSLGPAGQSFVSNPDSFYDFGWLFDGSHASGLDRVPFDGYRAILHKDEAVLRASEAAVWRGERRGNGGSSGNGTINVTQHIQAVPMSPSELAAQTKFGLQMLRFST